MNKDHIITKNGKDYVLYQGLLDEAHKQGLVSLKTTILQYPTEENNRTCIVEAVAIAIQDGKTRECSDIGDANPANVGGLAHCYIRMASTRAKARALRDLTNIGMVCIEEMEDHAMPARTSARPARPVRAQNAAPERSERPAETLAVSAPIVASINAERSASINAERSDCITESQIKAITHLCTRKRLAMPANLNQMNEQEARDTIVRLQHVAAA